MANELERFFKKVRKTAACWIWTASLRGGKNRDYGQFWDGEKRVYAHRFAYEQFKRPILAGQEIDHTCRNPSCVNPAHLEAVTHRVNLLRGKTVNAKNAAKTHCKRGHKFSKKNTYIQKTKLYEKRHCRTCQAAYAADYYQRVMKQT